MEQIKAIPTRYNGNQFRSRLEARWAVAFDKSGIEYQYEPETYDLPGLGWYCPDFYLPEYDLIVEIKNEKVKIPKYPRVYMAGPICLPAADEDPWRGFQLPATEYEGDILDEVFLDKQFVHENKFIYTGPFPATNGKSHGIYSSHLCDPACYEKPEIIAACLSAIDRADLVLAYMDNKTRYGTIFELGYARAKRTPVLLATSIKDAPYEIWFPISAAGFHKRCNDGTEARSWLLDNVPAPAPCPEREKIDALQRGGKKSVLISGDPVEYQGYFSNAPRSDVGGWRFRQGMIREEAAEAARYYQFF